MQNAELNICNLACSLSLEQCFSHTAASREVHIVFYCWKKNPTMSLHQTHTCKSIEKGRGCEDRIATLLTLLKFSQLRSKKNIQTLTSTLE